MKGGHSRTTYADGMEYKSTVMCVVAITSTEIYWH